jgi:16S rRNA (uracil1498-N3)-methyltransferase
LERWRRIALDASQQSRRAHLPEIGEPVQFQEVLATTGTCRYALDENPGAPPLSAALPETRSRSDEVVIMTGPEGGWTGEERSAFSGAFSEEDHARWTPVSLGPLILRAETAAIAALAIVRLAWLDLA